MHGQQHKLYGLDHLRAMAILMVVVYHYGRLFPHPEWVYSISKFGWTGVDLFFILSGYLISSQLFAGINTGKPIALNTFYIKRFFRIIPAYLAVVAVYFFIPATHEREGLAPLWKYLTFTQNYGLDLQYNSTFSHAWSLCIEEQFYLLFPIILIALVYFKRFTKGYWLLIGLVLLGFVLRWLSYTYMVVDETETPAIINWYKWIYYPTYCRLDGLLAGVAIAALFAFKPSIAARLGAVANYLFFIGLFVLAGAYFLCLEQDSLAASVWGFALVSLGYGFIVFAAVCPTGLFYSFSSRFTTTIATLSYAIYLTHKIVIHLVQLWAGGYNDVESNAMFAICMLACVLAAYLLHIVIEKPFLRLRDRFL
jgi:peptidoglycan/LPS O-acetylase OafA/YrhL